MATIRVPGPPPQAFQKNRPISDLVKSQIRHFQHLEHKLQLNLPTKFSPQDLTTEATAAQYIAEITTALCNTSLTTPQAPAPIRIVPSLKSDSTKSNRKSARQSQVISIAASAAPKSATPKKSRAKKHAPAKRPGKKL